MSTFWIWFFGSFAVATVIGSFFEWTLHRHVMHRPVGGFTYPFRAHTHIHHKVFKADHSYHLSDEKDKETIPMAWWNGPCLVMVFTLPFFIVSLSTGIWAVTFGAGAAVGAYYGTYEYLHWCMHLPRSRRVEMSRIFRRLNGHHLLHHRYMQKNFNVVLPLADLILGTLMVRSPCRFAQPVSPAVPDVQPKDPRSAQRVETAPSAP